MFTYTKYLRSCSLVLFFVAGVNYGAVAQSIHTCSIIASPDAVVASPPPTNLPGVVQKAVSYKPGWARSNQWKTGSTLTVRFMGGSSYLRGEVMRYANEWTQYANINFKVVHSGNADIRVAFTQNGASWSMVGNGSAYADQRRPSMNFGWLTDRTPAYEIRRTVLHEFGHALGLLHEHQNPSGGIPWDKDAVYAHYWKTQGWDRKTTYSNVMAVANRDATQYSAYDRASIMHYPVPAALTAGRYSVGMNKELSATDKAYIARLYPGRQVTTPPPSAPTVNRPTSPPTTSRPPTSPTQVRRYPVQITNALGKGQKEETIRLYIAERQYTIRLSLDGRRQENLQLKLPRGKYPYRLVTSSTFYGYRKVYRNGVARRQYVESEIPGGGYGTLVVDGSENFELYGSYDREERRLRVYLK
ncbi:MAG: M12 family metallopeptidase [Bacteroidota bacterium]